MENDSIMSSEAEEVPAPTDLARQMAQFVQEKDKIRHLNFLRTWDEFRQLHPDVEIQSEELMVNNIFASARLSLRLTSFSFQMYFFEHVLKNVAILYPNPHNAVRHYLSGLPWNEQMAELVRKAPLWREYRQQNSQQDESQESDNDEHENVPFCEESTVPGIVMNANAPAAFPSAEEMAEDQTFFKHLFSLDHLPDREEVMRRLKELRNNKQSAAALFNARFNLSNSGQATAATTPAVEQTSDEAQQNQPTTSECSSLSMVDLMVPMATSTPAASVGQASGRNRTEASNSSGTRQRREGESVLKFAERMKTRSKPRQNT